MHHQSMLIPRAQWEFFQDKLSAAKFLLEPEMQLREQTLRHRCLVNPLSAAICIEESEAPLPQTC